jgi:hypothetical protein
MADLPFGGRQMPGAAGRYLSLDMIKKQYGEDSPEYQESKVAYDLEQDKIRKTMEYQDALLQSAPKRYATTMGKTAMEEQDIARGVMPGTTTTGEGGQPIDLDQQKKLANRYTQKIMKDVTDPDARKRAIFATNMHVTMDNLPVDDLVSYSGTKGAIDLVNDKRLSLQGKTPERLKKYEEAMTASKTLAKQVRQFLGDSITPGVQQGLSELTNPTSWLQSPDVAKAKYNKFKEMLTQESNVLLKTLAGPEVLQGKAISGAEEAGAASENDPLGIR